MLRASMPKTPVDEHGDARAREHYVGGASKLSKRSPVYKEAQASSVEL